MTTGWDTKPLGELCDLVLGRTPARGSKAYWDPDRSSGNVWVSIADMSAAGESITDSKEYVSDLGASLWSPVAAGTLLMSFKLSIGKLAFAGVDLRTNEAIVSMPNISREVDKRYLFYYLMGFDWDALTSGQEKVKGKTLNKAKLNQVPVTFPPLEEQKRIVAILDAAFADIDQAEECLGQSHTRLADLQEEALWRAFEAASGTRVRMAEACSIEAALVDPRLDPYVDMVNVGAGNISTGTGVLSDLKSARDEGAKSNKFAYSQGAVLYSKIRPYLRKVARPEFAGLCSADIYPLTTNAELMDSNYLYWLLLSPQFTAYAISGSARAGMPKVNRPHLFAYELSLPSLDSQRATATKLDDLQSESTAALRNYMRKSRAVIDLRETLLHQVFTGQL